MTEDHDSPWSVSRKAFAAITMLSLFFALLGSTAVFLLKRVSPGTLYVRVHKSESGTHSFRVVAHQDAMIEIRRTGPPDYWPKSSFYPHLRRYILIPFLLPITWMLFRFKGGRLPQPLDPRIRICAISCWFGFLLLADFDPGSIFGILLASSVMAVIAVEIVVAIQPPLARAYRRALHFTPAQRRIRKGLCPDCGYDLRASPHRCPECGRDSARVGTI